MFQRVLQLIEISSYLPEKVSPPARRFLTASIFNGIGNGIFGVVLQLYIISLGFSGSQLGSIFMWSSVGQLLLTVPAGLLADRVGKKKVILTGFLFSGIAMLLLITGRTIFHFSLAWLLLGLGNSASSLFGPLYSSFFDHDDMDKAFGLQGFVNIASNAIGSLLGLIPPILVSQWAITLSRSYWYLLVFAIFIFYSTLPIYNSVLSSAEITKKSAGERSPLRSRGVVLKFSLLYTIQNIAFGSFFGLFPYYVNRKFGVESDSLGILFSVVSIVRAGANMIAPKIASRLGTLRTVSYALAFTVPFWLLFAVAPSFLWISLVYIIRFAISSVCNPLMPSLFYKLLYEDEKATANSITQTASMVSNIVAPKLGGFMMENIHIDSTALMGGGLYALYSLSFYTLLRNEIPKNNDNL